MQTSQNRRRFLATLTATGTAGLIGLRQSKAQDGRLETTTVRLAKIPGICIAPQYVAEDLLRAEGFTDIGREDDRYRRGRRLGHWRRSSIGCDHDHLSANQIGRQ